MKIAVASGKGGTGKTTVATSLACVLALDHEIWFLDCDVEAPNAHIFLNPTLDLKTDAVIAIPKIDTGLCTVCAKCVQVCQFHALAKVGSSILVFPQLCHGCGSCSRNCPEGAITELPNKIGSLEFGITPDGIHFSHGVLTIGEPMSTPIIRQLKKSVQPSENAVVILDSPPGASCSVVETLRGADYALLITEPTPFGLHDLKQMIGITEDMHIPVCVIINRDGIGDHQIDDFLSAKNIPILLRIPFSKIIASEISSGKLLIEVMPEFKQQLCNVFERIESSVEIDKQ